MQVAKWPELSYYALYVIKVQNERDNGDFKFMPNISQSRSAVPFSTRVQLFH